jgi:hypothetical protein
MTCGKACRCMNMRDAFMKEGLFRKIVPICCIAAKITCATFPVPYNSNHAALQHRQAVRPSHGADSNFLPQLLEILT